MALGTSVDDLLAVMRAKRRRLPFEIGAFVALQATERLLERAYVVDGARIFVRDDGKVVLDAEERCDESVALEGVQRVLASLLAAAGEGLPPMMLAFVEPERPARETTLAALRDSIEAALVPLNRSAAERVLARTIRDLHRDGTGASERAIGAADADLDALIEGRDSPDKPEIAIGSPDLLPTPETRRAPASSGDKRSIFRDEALDAEDELDFEDRPAVSVRTIAVVAVLSVVALVSLYFASR